MPALSAASAPGEYADRVTHVGDDIAGEIAYIPVKTTVLHYKQNNSNPGYNNHKKPQAIEHR